MKVTLAAIWQETENATSKEDLSIAGALPGDNKRTKASIGKDGGSLGIGQQRVVASTQFRLSDDVESTLQGDMLSAGGATRCEFQVAELVGYAQLGRRDVLGHAQYVVKGGSTGAVINEWNREEVITENFTRNKDRGYAEAWVTNLRRHEKLIPLASSG